MSLDGVNRQYFEGTEDLVDVLNIRNQPGEYWPRLSFLRIS